jgi:predicted dehydrogenase
MGIGRGRKIEVGVIGKRGHSRRLIEILKRREDVDLAAVYTPQPPLAEESGLPFTQRFEDLLSCRAIVIASPTPTHAGYLQRLDSYAGYLFLEKPAVSTAEETAVLKAWSPENKRRIWVDFNMRLTRWAEILRGMTQDPRIGTVLAFDVHTSYGLAFTDRYRKSWRSRPGASYGILETVGVHYINMALNLFGNAAESRADLRRVAGSEYPADFGVLHLNHVNGVRTTLRHSYAAPMMHRVFLLGSNGYWEFDGTIARLYSPRDTFDSRGYFCRPPVCQEWPIDLDSAEQASWEAAIDQFIRIVTEGKSFPADDFDLALDSMLPVFSITPNNRPALT